MKTLLVFGVLIFNLEILIPQSVMGYVGPGTGIAAIGALIAIVVAIVAAVFGFAWYPIRRLVRKSAKLTSSDNSLDQGKEP